jgi:hypothetical protein
LLTFGEYTDYKEMLKDLYCNKLWGMEQIGEHLGINKIVVRKSLVNDCGVEIRRKGRPAFKDLQMAATIELAKYSLATMTIKRKAIKN